MVIGAVTAVAVLAACSGGGADSATQGATQGATGGPSGQPAAQGLVESLPPATSEVELLRWNLPGEPETLDPANTVTYSTGTVVRNLCDSLLTMNPDLTLKPNLATFEVVSPTQIVYTIRDDARFWDGSPVTADDVAYSLNRTMDPAYVLSFILMNVDTIEATGDKEVTVNLKNPDSLVVNEMQNIGIMQKAFTEAAGDKVGTPDGGLMCSGPYKLDSWEPGSGLTLTRNDDYWNPEVTPLAQTVEFSFISDATALTQALSAGEVDGAYEVPASAVTALSGADTGRVVFGPSTQSVNLNVATPDGPLADRNLRQALQRVIDREALAQAIFNGAATPTYTMVTPATWPKAEQDMYQAAYDEIAAERNYDPEAARQLVAESSYDGTPIVLAIPAGEDTLSRTAQLIQQEAKAIGLNIEIKALQPLQYSEAGYDAAAREGIDLMIQSNFNAAPDPLEPIGFTVLPGQSYNYVEFDDPQVTSLITEAYAATDPKAKAEKIIEAQGIYEADSFTIPLVSTNTTTFLRNDLTGAVTSFAYWSMPSMAYIGTAE
jgi:peptide/nickel transport system substrate-binding protein